jgi:hypothetical protein
MVPRSRRSCNSRRSCVPSTPARTRPSWRRSCSSTQSSHTGSCTSDVPARPCLRPCGLGGSRTASPWIRAFEREKRFDDMGSALLEQIAFARFVESGDFARHLRRVRPLSRSRRDALVTALDDSFRMRHGRRPAAGSICTSDRRRAPTSARSPRSRGSFGARGAARRRQPLRFRTPRRVRPHLQVTHRRRRSPVEARRAAAEGRPRNGSCRTRSIGWPAFPADQERGCASSDREPVLRARKDAIGFELRGFVGADLAGLRTAIAAQLAAPSDAGPGRESASTARQRRLARQGRARRRVQHRGRPRSSHAPAEEPAPVSCRAAFEVLRTAVAGRPRRFRSA